jgi:hypothetical protein
VQVLHQYAGRMKLDLVFNESNGSCEGPFSARVCLSGSRGLQLAPTHRPSEHGVVVEATGVVSAVAAPSASAAAPAQRSAAGLHPPDACSRPAHGRCRGWTQAAVRLFHTALLSPPAPQAATKKLAKQLAAAAILEALLEGLPLEVFLSPVFLSSMSGGVRAGQEKMAVLYGTDRLQGSADDAQACLADYPGCKQVMHLAAELGAAACTPAMTLHSYAQRVGDGRPIALLPAVHAGMAEARRSGSCLGPTEPCRPPGSSSNPTTLA